MFSSMSSSILSKRYSFFFSYLVWTKSFLLVLLANTTSYSTNSNKSRFRSFISSVLKFESIKSSFSSGWAETNRFLAVQFLMDLSMCDIVFSWHEAFGTCFSFSRQDSFEGGDFSSLSLSAFGLGMFCSDRGGSGLLFCRMRWWSEGLLICWNSCWKERVGRFSLPKCLLGFDSCDWVHPIVVGCCSVWYIDMSWCLNFFVGIKG